MAQMKCQDINGQQARGRVRWHHLICPDMVEIFQMPDHFFSLMAGVLRHEIL